MNTLAVDLACNDLAACLLLDDDRVIEAPSGIGRPHSQLLAKTLGDLLEQAGIDWRQLDALALGVGPGSFTGIRIAAATLAGINANLRLPVLELSSLAVTARQADHAGPLLVLEDARAGDLYAGHYADGEAVEADRCLRWSEAGTLPPLPFVCHNDPAEDLAPRTRLPLPVTRARALALECEQRLQRLGEPLPELPAYPKLAYLQVSQAEKNAHA